MGQGGDGVILLPLFYFGVLMAEPRTVALDDAFIYQLKQVIQHEVQVEIHARMMIFEDEVAKMRSNLVNIETIQKELRKDRLVNRVIRLALELKETEG